MSTVVTGNPGGGGLTSPVPGRHVVPSTTAPTDGDNATGSSVLTDIETDIDWLAYLQLGGAWRDAAGGAATSFDGVSNPTAWNDVLTSTGSPVSGLDVVATFAAATGFHVTIGAGSGHLYTSVGIHPGESFYREIWWGSTTLLHSNPDPTNPRIDAITVTPAAFGTASTIAVVTGTAAATPMPPALASGSGVLFYVMVPAAGADATTFRACRGLGRRVGYPWSGMSAIVAGCALSWNYVADPTTTDAGLLVGVADQTGTNIAVNRLLIDGEAIEWVGGLQAGFGIVADSTANPFASPASASFDRPYYVYACGGRHNPLPSIDFTGHFNPITVCESTVAPNPKTGKPTGNLTVNGVTVTPDGAVYLGLGFVVANTTLRRGCVMDGEMTYAFNPLGFLGFTVVASGHNDMGTFTGNCQPAISTKMLLSAAFSNSVASGSACAVFLNNFPGSSSIAGSGIRGYCPASGSEAFNYVPVSFTPRNGAEIWAQLNSGGGTIQVYAMGFNHRVKRLIAGY